MTHSGATHGVLEGSPGVLASLFPWAIPRLQSGHRIVFGNLDDLPREAAVDRATYERFKVKAGLVVPLGSTGSSKVPSRWTASARSATGRPRSSNACS